MSAGVQRATCALFVLEKKHPKLVEPKRAQMEGCYSRSCG